MISASTRIVPPVPGRPLLRLGATTLALVLLIALPSAAGAAIHAGEAISLQLEDARLEQVPATLSDATGFIFAVDSGTAEQRVLDHLVSVSCESIPWDQALDLLHRISGFESSRSGQ